MGRNEPAIEACFPTHKKVSSQEPALFGTATEILYRSDIKKYPEIIPMGAYYCVYTYCIQIEEIGTVDSKQWRLTHATAKLIIFDMQRMLCSKSHHKILYCIADLIIKY